MPKFKSQATPNPDSLKITMRNGSFIKTGLLVFASKDEAEAHPLANSLFQIDGIVNVLILPEFITVTKNPSADWRLLWKSVEKTLISVYAASS